MENRTEKNKQNFMITEAYRKVAANIQFANIDDNIKTIMITSAIANEGKTTTTCNIATSLTELNKKILLIDLDLRKPSVHKYFKLSNRNGLMDLLLKKDSYKSYINTISSKLDVITTGKTPANPSEVINSNTIKEMIKELSEVYDYILLDTPPVMVVSDPISIASYSDAVIVTIGYSETEKDIVKKAVDSLKQVNANIIGTILNKVPVTKQNKYYYYSYY